MTHASSRAAFAVRSRLAAIRKRVFSDDEVGAIWRASEVEGHWICWIKLLILTCGRNAEVRGGHAGRSSISRRGYGRSWPSATRTVMLITLCSIPPPTSPYTRRIHRSVAPDLQTYPTSQKWRFSVGFVVVDAVCSELVSYGNSLFIREFCICC